MRLRLLLAVLPLLAACAGAPPAPEASPPATPAGTAPQGPALLAAVVEPEDGTNAVVHLLDLTAGRYLRAVSPDFYWIQDAALAPDAPVLYVVGSGELGGQPADLVAAVDLVGMRLVDRRAVPGLRLLAVAALPGGRLAAAVRGDGAAPPRVVLLDAATLRLTETLASLPPGSQVPALAADTHGRLAVTWRSAEGQGHVQQLAPQAGAPLTLPSTPARPAFDADGTLIVVGAAGRWAVRDGSAAPLGALPFDAALAAPYPGGMIYVEGPPGDPFAGTEAGTRQKSVRFHLVPTPAAPAAPPLAVTMPGAVTTRHHLFVVQR